MNINSHIRKIILLAFVVLSLSLIFPAVSYAATDAATSTPPSEKNYCENSNHSINEEYILTNVEPAEEAAKVLSKYQLGAVFSGVYNVKTHKWMALPSEGSSLLKEEDKSKFCTVMRKGGHTEVAKKFKDRLLNQETEEKNNVGFAIVPEPPILKLKFFSSKLNCPYTNNESRVVPDTEQKEIKAAIEKAVGKDYEVQKDKEPSETKCSQTHES